MKKILVPLFALSLSVPALASLGDANHNSVPNVYSAGLTSGAQGNNISEDPGLYTSEIISLIRDLERELVADATSQAISRVNGAMSFATKCSSFATDSDMGKWGDIIVEELKRSRPRYVLNGSSDLVASCPKYLKLSEGGRQAVWVMILNAMAHLESSCRTDIKATGPNGTLIGLLQLHKGEESDYSAGCRNGDGSSTEGTFRCGISMLDGQLRRDEALFSRKSYWDVLRPQAKLQKYKKIQSALSKFSLCVK